MKRSPRITLFLTGGTIGMVGRSRLDAAFYIESSEQLTEQQLMARVPELDEIAGVSVVSFGKVASPSFTPRDWVRLGRAIEAAVEGGGDGIVVAHGTSTLEETAFFLHLTLSTDRPVVFTGAMRPPSSMSPDGDLNLVNAVRVAAAPEAQGMGVLVVMNDTIHCARDVTKGSTIHTDAFRERDLGPLGYADSDGRVLFYRASTRRHTTSTVFDLAQLDDLPRIDVITSYAGAGGHLIEAAVAAGADGIVVAGTGPGVPAPAEEGALRRARTGGVAVCLCSRTGSGRVARRPGMTGDGFIAGDNLPAWKARILLGLALTVATDPDDLQAIFDTH